MDKWLREVIRLTFQDELGSDLDNETLFNVLLHGLPWSDHGLPGTAITNKYNWFQNLSDQTAPHTADAIILKALDNVLTGLGAQPWGTNARGQITFNDPVLAQLGNGVVHTMPFSSRSTYAQCIEYGSNGPVRIESMFPLGESGTVYAEPVMIPVFDPYFLGMTDVFDGFVFRPFPLFN
jgi:penicillin amidase